MAAANMVPWRYTDDNAKTYIRRADQFLTSQGGGTPVVGGQAADFTEEPSFPRNWRPRHVVCVETATGYIARVVCYSTTAPLWATPGQTVNVRDRGGASHTVVRVKQVGEKLGRTILH